MCIMKRKPKLIIFWKDMLLLVMEKQEKNYENYGITWQENLLLEKIK